MSGDKTSTFSIARRVAYDYLRDQKAMLAIAIFFMIVTAATTAGIAPLVGNAFGLIGQATKGTVTTTGQPFWLLPLEALGILWLRALASYVQQSRIDTVGERVVTAAQRDMF